MSTSARSTHSAPSNTGEKGALVSRRFWFGAVVANLACVASSLVGDAPFWLWLALGAACVILLSGPPVTRRAGVLSFVTMLFCVGAPNNAPDETQLTVAVVSVFLMALTLMSTRTPERRSQSQRWAVGLLVAYAAIQVIATWTSNSANVLVVGARFAIPVVLIVLLATKLGTRGARLYLDSVVLFAATQSTIAVLEYFGVTSPIFGAALTRGEVLVNPLAGDAVRTQAMMGHPILLGMIAMVGFLLVLFRRPLFPPGRMAVLLAVFVAALYLSGARSALTGVAVCIAFAIVTSDRGVVMRSLGGLVLAVLGLGVVIGSLSPRGILASQIEAFTRSGSFSHRIDALHSIEDLMKKRSGLDPLIGSGVGSEPRLFAAGFLQQDGFNIIDNQFVTSVATVGIIGLVLLIALIVLGLTRVRAEARIAFLSIVWMFFAFDSLRWSGPLILFAVLVSLSAPPKEAEGSDQAFAGSGGVKSV